MKNKIVFSHFGEHKQRSDHILASTTEKKCSATTRSPCMNERVAKRYGKSENSIRFYSRGYK
jgi:hypothetical protein